MRKLQVNKGFIALSFKSGQINNIYPEGKYWVSFTAKIEMFSRATSFNTSIPMNFLLENSALMEHLEYVEVNDNEIALKYVNGLFMAALTPGKYLYWKGVHSYRFEKFDISQLEVPAEIELVKLKRTELFPFIRILKVESYESALLFVNGKLEKSLAAGEYFFWKNATVIELVKVDARLQQLEVSGQEILTKDKASIRLSCFANYQVIDCKKAVVETKEYEKQLYIAVQLALREFVGTKTLDELLENKEKIGNFILEEVGEEMLDIGVQLSSCGVRDIILPGEMKDIMNQVLIAEKRAQANVITRREETASTRALLNTAKLLEENPMLLKLKEMEYVEKISEKIGEVSISGNEKLLTQLSTIFLK